MPNLKPIISVTEIANNLNLSRARFYQLLEQGFFPKPLIDERSKRPYYDLELQQKCLKARQSGIGVDGSFNIFYSPRKNNTNLINSKKCKKTNSIHNEFADTLKSMGLDCSVKDISSALSKLFPEGIKELEHGVVIRDLFRFLWSK